MSPWVEVIRANALGSDAAATATIMRTGIAFSAHFVRSNPDVLTARWVGFYVDDDARRMGFRFAADKPGENALTLLPNGRTRNPVGRVVQTAALFTTYPWLRAVANFRNAKDRRFQVNWDSVDSLYFISLRPGFERTARIPKEVPSDAVGIYRYVRGADVVYIGQGEIRAQASQDYRANWIFDRIEYSILPNETDRFTVEAYWIEEHKRSHHGARPEYNLIGGRSSDGLAAQQGAAVDKDSSGK